jgi:hypothetical protein
MATRRVRRPLARLLVAVCVYGATVELAVHIYCLHHVRMFGLIADVRCPLRVLELCGGVGCTHTNTVEHQIWPRELQGLRIAWKVRQSARATRLYIQNGTLGARDEPFRSYVYVYLSP